MLGLSSGAQADACASGGYKKIIEEMNVGKIVKVEILLSFFLLSLFFTMCKGSNKENVANVKSGIDSALILLSYYKNKDYNGTIDLASTLIKNSPNCAEYYYIRGGAYEKLSKFDSARSNYNYIISNTNSLAICNSTKYNLDSLRKHCYYGIGFMFLEDKKYKEAIFNFRKFYEFDSTNYKVLCYMAVCYYKMNQIEDAGKYIEKAYYYNQSDFEVLSNYGDYSLHIDSLDRALYLYNKAENIYHRQSTYLGKAIVFMRLKKVQEAEANFKEAMKMSDNPEVFYYYAKFRYFMADLPGYCKYLKKAKELGYVISVDSFEECK